MDSNVLVVKSQATCSLYLRGQCGNSDKDCHYSYPKGFGGLLLCERSEARRTREKGERGGKGDKRNKKDRKGKGRDQGRGRSRTLLKTLQGTVGQALGRGKNRQQLWRLTERQRFTVPCLPKACPVDTAGHATTTMSKIRQSSARLRWLLGKSSGGASGEKDLEAAKAAVLVLLVRRRKGWPRRPKSSKIERSEKLQGPGRRNMSDVMPFLFLRIATRRWESPNGHTRKRSQV